MVSTMFRPRRARTLLVLAVTAVLAGAAAPTDAWAYTYKIATRGTITVDVSVFARVVGETYGDDRGWTRAGVSFRRVSSGTTSNFTVVLAAANMMTSFSSVCSPLYSCRVGRYVIINQDRWRLGVAHWTSTLGAYRRMVINHETGHWLGLGHRSCPGSGALAPVMQQQSISLQGCKPNAWPTRAEFRAIAGGQ